MRRGQAGFLATEATDSLHLALCSRNPRSRRVRAQAGRAARAVTELHGELDLTENLGGEKTRGGRQRRAES